MGASYLTPHLYSLYKIYHIYCTLNPDHTIHEETVLVNAFIEELAARHYTRLLRFDGISLRYFTRRSTHLYDGEAAAGSDDCGVSRSSRSSLRGPARPAQHYYPLSCRKTTTA
ncbi:hypothetical protein J6590_084029 [Homalodisca vitripennis]|nr:hypothetical protein J6590_084029 [Homalodisca vitripennis]